MRAYCFASGLIEFGNRVPKGAIAFAHGPESILVDLVKSRARHGYQTRVIDGRPTKIPGSDTLLVPGIPEAPDQSAALDALHAWLKWASKKVPDGVEFLTS